jgi:hypothetical protein
MMTFLRSRVWVVLLALFMVVSLVACDDLNTVVRPDEPVVLTGAELPDLIGADPAEIVAFAHSRPVEGPVWTQIPVQVDERKVVGFGSQPANNTTAGVDGTVYGNGAAGATALQYADANTFGGADSNATFDADDELVFMTADGGGKPRAAERTEPAGVVAGSGVQVQIDDPLGDDDQAWVYLFLDAADGPALDPSAGQDYVDYNFVLTSGAYKTTYKRADGPNPETSTAVTDTYTVGFTDRWYENRWQITDGATGVDILDGNKNLFALGVCGRSNATFADAEGAFVANIDGPVRAIRSYVGANSGPLTQRTHRLYRDREEIQTDLRVHAIPGIMDFLDYSTAASGMTYYSSTTPGGVPVDGAADTVGPGLPAWELVTGAQGSVKVTNVLQTTLLGPGDPPSDVATGFYRDELNSPIAQCWGDAHFIGASGSQFTVAIPNTDPRTLPFDTLSATRVVGFDGPGVTPTQAADWAADVAQPLTLTVASYTP